MKKQADYIKRIEIKSLWGRRKNISWDLRPDVNILSGINGIGKSTILNNSVRMLDVLEGKATDQPQPTGSFFRILTRRCYIRSFRCHPQFRPPSHRFRPSGENRQSERQK